MSMLEINIKKHIDVFNGLIVHEKDLEAAINLCTNALSNEKKLFICGNGGSASDAQHLAAEFIGRYTKNRRPLAAICLNTDTSALTCISNDFSYASVFERQLRGLANIDDVFIVFSTSGMSENIINSCKAAIELGLKVIGFLGKGGGDAAKYCDVIISIDSMSTANIQEAHIFMAHMLCGEIEKKMKLV